MTEVATVPARGAGLPAQAFPAGWGILAREDFQDFPVGPFPYDYSPEAVYHDIQPEGYRGRWREATVLSGWRDAASWNVVDDDGQPALEQSCLRDRHLPMVETGSRAWSDYRLTARLRPLFSKPAAGAPVIAPMARTAQGVVGLIARYADSRNYYALVLTSDDTIELRRSTHDGQLVLAAAPLPVDQDHTYLLTLEVVGDQLSGLVDDQPVVAATDRTFREGKVALVANVPARFGDVIVAAPPAAQQAIRRRLGEEERLLLAEREQYPQPVLVRSIATPGFGASKHVRFADLDGDGRQEIILAQALDRGPRDAYRMLTCITVLDLDGRVRWQFGRPTAFKGRPTSDLCFQVYDLDLDGNLEVILTKDFQLIVLDGRTGQMKQAVPTPPAPPPENMFYRTIGDSLAIANLRGRQVPQDLLLKDRYHNVWAYDDKLELLWTAQGITTGHFPALYDLDGDGKDEIVMGYSCLDHDGAPLWSLAIGDHADGIAVGTFNHERPDEVEIRLAASDEGLLWVSADGRILERDRTGHVQRFSIANFRPDQPGLEMVTITFWGEPGIMAFYDSSRRRYASRELNHQASPLHPTNWTGDGQELIFYSGNSREGGLLDGWGRQVVLLPDDGHPSRCHQPVDLFGDERDELVVWDYQRLCIYTQDRPSSSPRAYHPRRLQPYNVSNYRAEVSLPGWEEPRG